MNLLVVGASYRTAEVELLERLSVPAAELPDLVGGLLRHEEITEAVVLSTCNRVEVYAGVTGFHGGLTAVSAALAELAGVDRAAIAGHLYVHWDADAVTHTLRVAAGLDSLVTGEPQILGQLRDAYAVASEADATGRLLHDLMQQALRVGKRVHAETGIDTAGRSMVSAALAQAAVLLEADSLAARPALVVGGGAMGALALATLSRAGAAPLYLASRDRDRASRLAASYGAQPVGLAEVGAVMATVDVVISATASVTPVLRTGTVAGALAARDRAAGPVVICDLAVPRDVEAAVAELDGAHLIDVARLAETVTDAGSSEVAAAEAVVAGEAAALASSLRDLRIGPTVAALRARADEVVAAELHRLATRRPELTDEQRAEVAHAVHRLVQRLLHQPTVRVRQLASEPGGETYAAALAELFDLQLPRPERADRVPSLTEEDGDQR